MKNFTKILSLVLALVLVFSLAACKKTAAEETKPTETQPVETKPAETEPEVEVKPVTFFAMSYCPSVDELLSLTAFDMDGFVSINYFGAETKMGEVEMSALEVIGKAVAEANLAAFDGKSEYADGEASASMYVEFADGTMISADFGGVIPANFITAYEAMDVCFQELAADIPVYVPEVAVMGEVNEEVLAEMQAIMNGSGIPNLDAFGISDVAKDEFFNYTMGLTSDAGIVNGTSCAGMMMTTAYSLVIATVEDAANIQAVRDDFQNNVDWGKWVCVRPTDALVAQKGNMVLCLIAADELFTGTMAGIEAAGWENITAFKE